jgi:hypothetical protein
MGKVVKKIKHEMTQVFRVTLYFFIAFGIILTLKKLFLSQYNIGFYDISGVVVGALIMGKVVPLLDHTGLGRTFSKSYLILNVLFKTIVYSLIADSLYLLEHVIKARDEHGGFVESLSHAIEHPNTNQILIIILCTFVALFIYNSFSAVNDHLGKNGLYKLFFTRRNTTEE